jgi:hypothetical protein
MDVYGSMAFVCTPERRDAVVYRHFRLQVSVCLYGLHASCLQAGAVLVLARLLYAQAQ